MSEHSLDLFVLNGRAPNLAITLAKRGPDIAIVPIELDGDIKRFVDFTDRVEKVVLGEPRPSMQELDTLGKQLFDHIFQGEVLRLYNRLPNGRVSIQIVTDEPPSTAFLGST